MATNCQRYPQAIQFTFRHKTYLSYDEAKRALINKNLLEAEPAVVFYYSGNPRTEHVMFGIGNKHDSSQPLIITESITPSEAEKLTSLIGEEEINIPIHNEYGEPVYITTITSAINYLAQAIDTDNYLGDYDYSNDIAKIFESMISPKYSNGVYTYRIHMPDGSDTIAQLELYTDENNHINQVFLNQEGKKVTRKKINQAWTSLSEVIPFTKEYLEQIIGTGSINDNIISLNSTWSSQKISNELKRITLDTDSIFTEYTDPSTGETNTITQAEWNSKIIKDFNDKLIEVMPDWSPIN